MSLTHVCHVADEGAYAGCLQGGAGVCPGEGVCRGGCRPRALSAWGVSALGVCGRMTDRCKNITLPQLRCGR